MTIIKSNGDFPSPVLSLTIGFFAFFSLWLATFENVPQRDLCKEKLPEPVNRFSYCCILACHLFMWTKLKFWSIFHIVFTLFHTHLFTEQVVIYYIHSVNDRIPLKKGYVFPFVVELHIIELNRIFKEIHSSPDNSFELLFWYCVLSYFYDWCVLSYWKVCRNFIKFFVAVEFS